MFDFIRFRSKKEPFGIAGKMVFEYLGSDHLNQSCIKKKSRYYCKETCNSVTCKNRNRYDKADEKSDPEDDYGKK